MKNLLLLLLLVTLAGCQTTKISYLNTQELQSNYPRLMAFNFRIEEGLEGHQKQLTTELEPQIRFALQQRGFQFVPSTRLYEVHSELLAAETNLYDSVTGQRDEVRSREIWLQALKQIKTELNIDAFVYYGIMVTPAPFTNNFGSMFVAKWHGKEESALLDGVGAGKVLGAFFVETRGSLPGLSVFVQFEDEFDNTISFGAGGIELLAQFNNEKEVIYKDFNGLFQDRQKLELALQYALQQIDSYRSAPR